MEDEKSELLHGILRRDLKKPQKSNPNSEKNQEEAMKQKLLETSEISLILNTYDDIFSDFDPRPYFQRALSDDFLIEAKRAARDKIIGMELKFLLPRNIRNAETESTARKRLHEHFKKHAFLLEEENRKKLRLGIMVAIIGMILTSGGASIMHFLGNELLWNILIVILEPAGWFTVWKGFDFIFEATKAQKPDLDFYRKMSKADISFSSY